MPAIISIILIRLDQFIIAGPRATSHLNEFNWKGKKLHRLQLGRAGALVNGTNEPHLKCYPPSLQNILEQFSAEGNQSDYKPCVRARIEVDACVQSFWSIKHRITILSDCKKITVQSFTIKKTETSIQRVTELEKMTFVFIGYLFIIPKLSFSSLKRVQLYPQLKLADGLMRGNLLTKLVPTRNDKK